MREEIDKATMLAAWKSHKETMTEHLRSMEKNESDNRRTRLVSYITLAVVVVSTALNLRSDGQVVDAVASGKRQLVAVLDAVVANNEASVADWQDREVRQAEAQVMAIQAQVEVAPDPVTKEKRKKKLREAAASAKAKGASVDLPGDL